ncbi:MAG: LppX_LprAFG lipoprotein [Chloroflexi bacterium]|nr:MAG: LppX_LprAFG lipoprotein [Chloroflexota bacterium]
MKRLLASLVMVAALAACGAPLAKSETPQQALAAAAQRASQLKSAKFDFNGGVTMTFPAALAQSLGQSSSNGTLVVNLSGNGEAQFPDRYHAGLNAKMTGFSVATEVIVANGQAYVKNPITNKWQASSASGGLDQLGQPDPLSYDQLLKNVQSIKDLGDTSLNGTAVHHYQLTPDKAKLLASLNKSGAKNAQALAAMKQVLDSGTMTVEVWFGKDDHLARRLSTDASYAIDLNQLLGALGSAATPSRALPAGSTIHATARVAINYHDFDAPVTISIPPVG